jgi:hypothetical protein
MMRFLLGAALLAGLIVLTVRVFRRPGGRRVFRGPGAGASGAVYDMLNEDKRRAIEIIVEGRAEQTDPETADDIPPEEAARRRK